MSFAHYHAICRNFSGTAAERLVVITMALSIDYNPVTKYTSGITDPCMSVGEIARRCGMTPINVRKILRRFQGSTPGVPEEGKWFYPVAREPRQGQVVIQRYWMPLHPLPMAKIAAPARNKTGKGLKKDPQWGGFAEPPQGGGFAEPAPVPPQGLPNPPGEVRGTLEGGVRRTDIWPSLPHALAPPPPPTSRPGDTLRSMMEEIERRKSGDKPPPAAFTVACATAPEQGSLTADAGKPLEEVLTT